MLLLIVLDSFFIKPFDLLRMLHLSISSQCCYLTTSFFNDIFLIIDIHTYFLIVQLTKFCDLTIPYLLYHVVYCDPTIDQMTVV